MLVARLKVTLSDVEPQVLRRFDGPLKIRLSRLHKVIQAAMGWTDTRLHEFKAGGVGWGVPDPDGFHEHPLPARKTSLPDVMDDVGTKTIHYICDFGDNWHHMITVEKIDDASPGAGYPRLVRAIRACPPEDIGGVQGYADFREALADPAHEAQAEMPERYGSDFGIEDAGIDRILDKFGYLAKKWAPRPRKTPAKIRSS